MFIHIFEKKKGMINLAEEKDSLYVLQRHPTDDLIG